MADLDERLEQLDKIFAEAKEIFIKKNTDYGNSFSTYGPVGVIVRLGDKIQRLMAVSQNGVSFVEDEKIRDTLLDLYNYSAMALMLLDEEER